MFLSRFFDGKQRAARKSARMRIKEARKLLRRARRAKASSEMLGEVTAQTDKTVESLRGAEVKKINKATDKLTTLLDKHLDGFRKPAWRESLESILIAVLVALLLRSFVVEAFKIPSGSMIPTLAIGDQIFVNKMLYGVRIPFTTNRILHFADPERGEVIVFVCPEEPHEDYIKRIIGLPGDEIKVRGGEVNINGKPLEREFVERRKFWDRDQRTDHWYTFEANVYRESIGDNDHRVIYDADPAAAAPDFGPAIVPEDHVFMMGDNRDHSYDSRSWGPVQQERILGRSLFVWFSYGRDGLAWGRLGTKID